MQSFCDSDFFLFFNNFCINKEKRILEKQRLPRLFLRNLKTEASFLPFNLAPRRLRAAVALVKALKSQLGIYIHTIWFSTTAFLFILFIYKLMNLFIYFLPDLFFFLQDRAALFLISSHFYFTLKKKSVAFVQDTVLSLLTNMSMKK